MRSGEVISLKFLMMKEVGFMHLTEASALGGFALKARLEQIGL
jgi:hypothetical protein